MISGWGEIKINGDEWIIEKRLLNKLKSREWVESGKSFFEGISEGERLEYVYRKESLVKKLWEEKLSGVVFVDNDKNVDESDWYKKIYDTSKIIFVDDFGVERIGVDGDDYTTIEEGRIENKKLGKLIEQVEVVEGNDVDEEGNILEEKITNYLYQGKLSFDSFLYVGDEYKNEFNKRNKNSEVLVRRLQNLIENSRVIENHKKVNDPVYESLDEYFVNYNFRGEWRRERIKEDGINPQDVGVCLYYLYRENPTYFRGVVGVFLDLLFQLKIRIDERFKRDGGLMSCTEFDRGIDIKKYMEVEGGLDVEVGLLEEDEVCKIITKYMGSDYSKWKEGRGDKVDWRNVILKDVLEYLLDYGDEDKRLNIFVLFWMRNRFSEQSNLVKELYKEELCRKYLRGGWIGRWVIEEEDGEEEKWRYDKISLNEAYSCLGVVNRLSRDVIIPPVDRLPFLHSWNVRMGGMKSFVYRDKVIEEEDRIRKKQNRIIPITWKVLKEEMIEGEYIVEISIPLDVKGRNTYREIGIHVSIMKGYMNVIRENYDRGIIEVKEGSKSRYRGILGFGRVDVYHRPDKIMGTVISRPSKVVINGIGSKPLEGVIGLDNLERRDEFYKWVQGWSENLRTDVKGFWFKGFRSGGEKNFVYFDQSKIGRQQVRNDKVRFKRRVEKYGYRVPAWGEYVGDKPSNREFISNYRTMMYEDMKGKDKGYEPATLERFM